MVSRAGVGMESSIEEVGEGYELGPRNLQSTRLNMSNSRLDCRRSRKMLKTCQLVIRYGDDNGSGIFEYLIQPDSIRTGLGSM